MNAEAAGPLLTVNNVEVVYGVSLAVRGVSFEVPDHGVVALLGPNGAGKSTALSLLLGLRRPDCGSAHLFGRSPCDPEARRRVGVTPQATAFPATLRVGELVQLVSAHFAAPVPATELLGRFGIGGHLGGREQHDELVPAEARHQVAGPQAGPERPRHLAQHQIPRRVPVRVVDGLEVVDVDVEQ